ncbi:probable glutathione S-transferase GSTU6 [Triticum aestivum]|uniref:probable glutathione S-transferase GSTU6 n=1 Tax=Triticum aestivum TaxID=4565 RepID=UPI001D01FEFA|nr:probable glutathione S-transferase GSTU6 [Triticum aestivum]
MPLLSSPPTPPCPAPSPFAPAGPGPHCPFRPPPRPPAPAPSLFALDAAVPGPVPVCPCHLEQRRPAAALPATKGAGSWPSSKGGVATGSSARMSVCLWVMYCEIHSSILGASVDGTVVFIVVRSFLSSFYVEYLDDAPGLAGNDTSILPADPYSRAAAHVWAAYVNDKLFPSCTGILKTAKQEERASKVEETLSGLRHLEAALAECSKGEVEAPFFGGCSIGFLDIALGCYLPWFEAVGRLAGLGRLIDPARTPKLAAWAERFRVVEPVKALLPRVDELEQYITTVLYPKWNVAVTGN